MPFDPMGGCTPDYKSWRMYCGEDWFAWHPVRAKSNSGWRWCWLETVWRDQTLNRDGTVAATHYYTD